MTGRGQDVTPGSGTGARPGRYAEQARTYDLTRAASPTVLRLVAKYLGSAGGRRLLDIAGGTGNYAQVLQARGFHPVVVDAEAAMVARSEPKIGAGRQVIGDAEALPFRDESFDCAMLVAALHLLGDPRRALSEARRVIRDGPFVLQAFTRENVRALFVTEYFRSGAPVRDTHPAAAELEEWLRGSGFSAVEHESFVYLDTVDGTMPALHTDPLRLAGPAYLRNNSWFQRLPDDVREEGLARLAEDLRSGVLAEKVKASFEAAVRSGHGTVFVARP